VDLETDKRLLQQTARHEHAQGYTSLAEGCRTRRLKFQAQVRIHLFETGIFMLKVAHTLSRLLTDRPAKSLKSCQKMNFFLAISMIYNLTYLFHLTFCREFMAPSWGWFAGNLQF
jgi:hypothetical protein